MKKTILALMTATVLLSACSRNLSGDTYSSSNTVGKVVYGTVVSARTVTVKDKDKLEDNTLGGLGGGVAGGVAGSAIGGGTGRSLTTVGGAIGGAVLGALIQDQFGTSQGTEYIVQLDSAQQVPSATSKRDYRVGRTKSASEDINQAIQVADQKSEAISVVQKDEGAMLPAGQRVMVVFNDDRPRVIAVR